MSDFKNGRNVTCRQCNTTYNDADGNCDCVICAECDEDVSEYVDEAPAECWEHWDDIKDLRRYCATLTSQNKRLVRKNKTLTDAIDVALDQLRDIRRLT